MKQQLPKSPYYTERIYRSYKDMFTIMWVLTRQCNFQCVYDYQPTGDCIEFDIDTFINKISHIKKPFRLVITGGEPFTKSWIISLCQKVGALGGIIEIQTNFSIDARKFIDNTSPKYIELISTSLHPQERTRIIPNGINEFIKNYHYARSKGFDIRVWFIDYPGISQEEHLKYCKQLYDAGIIPMRKRYLGIYNNETYIGDSVIYKNMLCSAGHNIIAIWEDFTVTPCEADRTILGNFLTGFICYEKPILCKKEHAGCLCRESILNNVYDVYYKQWFGIDEIRLNAKEKGINDIS